MPSTRSILVKSAAVTATVAFTLLSASPAMAESDTLLRAKFVGTFPVTDPVSPSPVIAGVLPGGAPWELNHNSRVRVREDGRISVNVRDLVIPGRGNPAAMMAASLVCGGVVVDSTDAFAVDAEGDGRITDRIAVPDDCADPVVLVRNATNPAGLGAYFAVAMAD